MEGWTVTDMNAADSRHRLGGTRSWCRVRHEFSFIQMAVQPLDLIKFLCQVSGEQIEKPAAT